MVVGTTERQKYVARDLLSLCCHLGCPLSTKSEDYLSVWGVDGRKI